MKWHLGPNSVLRESIFAGNQFFHSSKSNLITWVLYFLALLMEKLRMCKPPAQGHTAKKVWNQPFSPGSPASLPTKLSSHQVLCSQGRILLHHLSRRESSEEQRLAKCLITCSVTKLDWSHFADPLSLCGSFSFYYVTETCQRGKCLCTNMGNLDASSFSSYI